MISIITPSYNRAHLLNRMIRSVINQSFTNWELIIMDDGSTDDSKEIVEAFSDKRITYHYSENSGAAVQRNKGVELAKGSHIIFLDSDDWVEQDWLDYMWKGVNMNELATCGYKKIDEDFNVVKIQLPKNLGQMFDNLTLNFISGTLIMPQSYFYEIHGYDLELASGQHTDLLLRLIPVLKKYNAGINVIPEPLVNIFNHSGNRIRLNDEALYHGSLGVLKKHNEIFSRNSDMYFNFLSVAAVSAYRIGKISETKFLIRKALIIKPFSYLAYGRYFIAHLPFLRKRIWARK